MKKRNCKSKIIKEITKFDNGIIYRYILSETKSEQVASFNLPLYSIEIIMIRDGETTKNSADEIFADVGKAISFFEKLANNLATPIDLPYLIEDRITF